jgi:hypothetical protein
MKSIYLITILALGINSSLPSALAQSIDPVIRQRVSERYGLLSAQQSQFKYKQNNISLPQDNSRDYSTPRSLQLPKFPFQGQPSGRRRGGASRNECPISAIPVTALVPGTEETANKNSKSFLASTVNEYPTFWVYVPVSSTKKRSGEFVLQNDTGQEIYRSTLTLPKQAGAIGLSLPKNPQYSLKTNNTYHWYFKLFCDREEAVSQDSSDEKYIYVDASIERVALTDRLGHQSTKIASRDYITYAENNLWYDAIDHLANLRLSEPKEQTYQQDWSKLLTASGLSDLAAEPIVKIYQLR